jgi:hypothetical protein
MTNYTSREELMKKIDTTKGVTICATLDEVTAAGADDETRVAGKEPCAICNTVLAIHKDTVDNPLLSNTLKLCYRCAAKIMLMPAIAEAQKNEPPFWKVYTHLLFHPFTCGNRIWATFAIMSALLTVISIKLHQPFFAGIYGWFAFFFSFAFWRETHRKG